MTAVQAIAQQITTPLVHRRQLKALGLTESTIDHVWRRVPLARVDGDTKTYAPRDEVLAILREVVR